MGFLDKLKNVFFEEEEVEEEIEKPSPLAKKVEIVKKKPIVQEEHVEPVEVHEEYKPEETILPKEDSKTTLEEENNNNKFSMMFEDEDFVVDKPREKESYEKNETEPVSPKRSLYPDKKEESYTDILKKETNYGYTKSYYESKETKTFTPSPIISPIYGILDKNYKKEEVITKKEVRITSSRGKPDLDTVRNKAFGDIADELLDARPKNNLSREKALSNEKVKEKEVNVYDVNKNKPSIKGVTLQDADEYYNDLGLAYNVDYSDKQTDRNNKRNKDKLEDNLFDLIESMYDKED